MPVPELHVKRARRATDIESLAAAMPDMVEEVRFTVEAGRGPALVVSRRKISGALRAQLRDVTIGLADDT